MQRERSSLLAAVTDAAARESAACDATGAFPKAAFKSLSSLGVTSRPPLLRGGMVDLLWLLAAVGRGDLSVGRIFEGHVNVLYLIDSYGTPEQRRLARSRAGDGALYGVWNTDIPRNPLRVEGGKLTGGKSFATGVDGLQHAIVTAASEAGRQMMLVPLTDVTVDRSWWRPMGMKASGSHMVDFTGMEIAVEWMIGGPDAYIEQPWFSAGAIRFAAVQVGGMHALLDVASKHLRDTGRSADPYQRHRLGEMAVSVETGYGWLQRAAASWTATENDPSKDLAAELIATANGARKAIEDAALRVLELAERSVGAAGLIAPHRLEQKVRDLRTYLRQPNPDGVLASLGESVAAGTWQPGALRTYAAPMSPAHIDAERIAIVAPHPDDETLGCGGLIASLAPLNRRLLIIFVTDGAASHIGSPTWPKRRLAQRRRAEAEAALSHLGLSGNDALFLDLPDAAMPAGSSIEGLAARDRLAAAFASFNPDLVILPWRRDPHCDHRDAWTLARSALDDAALSPDSLEYAVWLDELGEPGDHPCAGEAERIDFDVRAVLEAKRAALAAHVTQTTDLIKDAARAFKLDSETIDRLVSPIETYWRPL